MSIIHIYIYPYKRLILKLAITKHFTKQTSKTHCYVALLRVLSMLGNKINCRASPSDILARSPAVLARSVVASNRLG